MNITKGEGALGRIYERLRKRDYRARGGGGSPAHLIYLKGLRDALKATQNQAEKVTAYAKDHYPEYFWSTVWDIDGVDVFVSEAEAER